MNDNDITALENSNAELLLAAEPLAQIYDKFLKEKGEAWCKHWESIPLNMLLQDDVRFIMPTLNDCRIAKMAIEGNKDA